MHALLTLKKAFDSIWHQGLFYKLIESGIGGKTYDLIKSMYTESKCGVKINTKRTRYLSQERGVRQGCCLSPTLFNIYINELALSLERSAAPGLALHDSQISVWGPLTNPSQDLTKWEKHPIETLHAELCKNILHVHRHTTNNACRAELGKYPLITKIQKRAIKFWKHLKLSDPQSYHYKALQYQEMSKESKPFLQLIQSFSPDASLTSTDALNHNIRTNQITAQIKQSYITHWQTQTQQQSKMQCYLSLKREYSMAEYLFTVSDKKLRSTLIRYRLSGHKLMIETGRHRQTWLPPEQRLCSHCDLNQMETELHFLTECSKYTDIRTVYYDKIQQIHPTFTTLPDQEKLAYLLGEHKTCCVLAAQYVSLCHHRREDTPSALS